MAFVGTGPLAKVDTTEWIFEKCIQFNDRFGCKLRQWDSRKLLFFIYK